MKVGASNGVTPPLIKKKSWPGGGVSGQPEKKPGYATGMGGRQGEGDRKERWKEEGWMEGS